MYKKIAVVDSIQNAKQMKEELIDRYGTIPKPVENLILISLIKSFAALAGIVSVIRNGRVFTLKYGDDNTPDAAQLLEILTQYQGVAQLKAGDPPYIVFKAQNNAVDRLLKFLRDIRRCII